MITCPNKNLPEWKELVEKVGENLAYVEWNLRYNEGWQQPSISSIKPNEFEYNLQLLENIKTEHFQDVFNKGVEKGWVLSKVLDEVGGFEKNTGLRKMLSPELLETKVDSLDYLTFLNEIKNKYSFNIYTEPSTSEELSNLAISKLENSQGLKLNKIKGDRFFNTSNKHSFIVGDDTLFWHVNDIDNFGNFRVYEIQSDIFQNQKQLISNSEKDNKTLLSRFDRNNKWLEFAIDNIVVQAKNDNNTTIKFPIKNTVSKIQNFSGYESRLQEVVEELSTTSESDLDTTTYYQSEISRLEKILNKNIPNTISFYDTTIKNILNDKYGEYLIEEVDSEGNTWLVLNLKNVSPSKILFNKFDNVENYDKLTFTNDIDTKQEVSEDKNIKHFQDANENTYKNVSSVISNILNNYKDSLTPQFEKLLKNLSKSFLKTDAKFIIISDENLKRKLPDSENVSMFYSSNENTVYVTEEALRRLDNYELVTHFTHELAHARSSHAIHNPVTFEERDFSEFIHEAYSQYKTLAERRGDASSYGFKSVDEFVAEIYSNSEFVEELNQIQQFWKVFKNRLLALLGLSSDNKNKELIDTVLLVNKVKDFIENSEQDSLNQGNKIVFDALFKTFEEFSDENILPDTIYNSINELMNAYQDFNIDPSDNNYYINNKTGKRYKRVTTVISEGFNDSDPIVKKSTEFGDAIDVFIRDFFAEKLRPLDEYNFANDTIKNELLLRLNRLSDIFNSRGEFVISENIVLHNDELEIAGTVDLITIDKDGRVRIYDIKTMRGNNFNESYGSSKFESTAVFEPTGELKEDGSFKYKLIKGKTQKSKKQKYQEQLSLYNILLNNTYGIKASELSLIPFELDYNATDTQIQNLRAKSFIRLEPLENVEGVKMKENSKFRTTVFSNKNLKYDLKSIESKLEFHKNEILNSIEKNLKSHITLASRLKNSKYKKAYRQTINKIEEFKKQKENFENISEINTFQAIVDYIFIMEKNIRDLRSSMIKEISNSKNIQLTIKKYSDFLDAYTSHKDLTNFINEISYDNVFTPSDKALIEDSLASISRDYNGIKNNIIVSVKRNFKKMLESDIRYLPEVETLWRNKLYREWSKTTRSQDREQWVIEQMNTTFKEDIQKDMIIAAKNIVDNPGFDVSYATMMFNSATNNSSKFVSIVNSIIKNDETLIVDDFTKFEKDLYDNIFKPLIKEKGTSDPKTLYKNLISYDENSKKYYLVDKYKTSYLIELEKRFNELNYIKFKEGDTSKNYVHKNLELKKYIKENEINNLNDLSHLSVNERKALEYFKNINKKVNKETFNRGLVKIFGRYELHGLPSITKGDLEHITSGTYTAALKDKVKSAFTIRPDDINFKYNTDGDGNILYDIPIRYRGELSKEEQSLDLANIFRLEYSNGLNFSVKNKSLSDLQAIVEVVKNKDFYSSIDGKNYITSLTKNKNKTELISGENSNTIKNIQNMIEKHSFDVHHKYAGKILGSDTNKLIGTINSYTASVGLSLNWFSATANVLNGNAMLFLEGLAKDKLSLKSIKNAEITYTSDLHNILADTTKSIPTSKTNLMLRYFDTMGFNESEIKKFINEGLIKSHLGLDFLMYMQNAGEHWIQSVTMYTVLSEIKVLNANSQFIDKNGNVVSTESEAASLLDMMEIEDGVLKPSNKFTYTTHSMTVPFNEGGRVQVSQLVEKKIFDMFGNYKKNTQPEAMRHWWGKLILLFRRFFVALGVRRFRGFGNSLKSLEQLDSDPDRYQTYSYALKDYEEGVYTSMIRFIRYAIIPAIKQFKFSIIKEEYTKLSKHQQGNIRYASSELMITTLLLPLLKTIVVASFGDDDDSENKYFILYQIRRLETELAQYRNIQETLKMVRSPFASVRTLDNVSSLLMRIISLNFDERYETGKNAGELKIVNEIEKLIPVLNQFEKDSKVLYNFQDNSFIPK